MSAKRAAGYFGGTLLLLAWLASASGLVRQTTDVQEPTEPVETAGTAMLASDVQAQALRLKNRLATAPAPQEPHRNPFTFAPREVATRRERRVPAPAEALTPPPLPVVVEPAFELIGVAESQSPRGVVRTAMISALSGELFLVKEGEVIAGRYRVKAVSPDAVELNDLVSETVRRLALRN